MPPQTPIGQLNQSMQAGTPALGQVSGGSPNFQPSLQPPTATPMPNKSPASMIHAAAARRGMDLSQHPQLQGGQAAQPDATLPIQDDNPQQPGVQVPVSEAELIIKALSKRLDHHSKTTEHLVNTFFPQPPAPEQTNG